MSAVAFVVHAGRPEAIEVASALSRTLSGSGVETRRLASEPIDAAASRDPHDLADGADVLVAVGGDGTFLRAAQTAYAHDCPVAGVKVGRLGFLTEVEPEEALDVIREVLDGRARIEERMPIVARSETFDESQWALNEIIIEKRTRHRLVRLAVQVDGSDVTTFSADAVIVATATGSTAYSFSARGPILVPSLRCIVVTPVAAHMVFDRSFVLGAQETVRLEVVGEEPGDLSADGRASLPLPVGASVEILAAPKPSLMVRPSDGKSFFAIVREKFGLPRGPST